MDPEYVDAGRHGQAEILSEKDVNGRFMVKCTYCGTYAHHYDKEQAIQDLIKTKCVRFCENCNSLDHSYDESPAVPLGGTCNDRLHVCPNDGNRWWQSNTYFHLWQQVTNDEEWKCLINQG